MMIDMLNGDYRRWLGTSTCCSSQKADFECPLRRLTLFIFYGSSGPPPPSLVLIVCVSVFDDFGEFVCLYQGSFGTVMLASHFGGEVSRVRWQAGTWAIALWPRVFGVAGINKSFDRQNKLIYNAFCAIHKFSIICLSVAGLAQ